MGKDRLRQNVALHSAPGAYEVRGGTRLQLHQRAGDRQSRIKMAPRSPSGEKDSHAATATGSVARSP